MLIDTHCHLSFKAFREDWKEIVRRAVEKDIQMITVGAAKETSEKAITIAKEEDGVFASVGLHPTHAEEEEFDYGWFSSAAGNPKVVAIGETGIDHYHVDDSRHDEILRKQEDLLRCHLEIAKEKDLPVILHARDGKYGPSGAAYEHLYRFISDFGYYRCVLHCFGGSWEWARKFLDLGLLISFTGIVTFKSATKELLDVVKKAPQNKFMVETDSPYLSPHPVRSKQNEPAFVEYIARGIAQIRGEEYDDVAKQTTENAKKFFNI